MKRPDFVTLRVKKRRRLISSVRSSSDDRDESMCPSGAFKSPDERLRLNHFKFESSPIEMSPRTPTSK